MSTLALTSFEIRDQAGAIAKALDNGWAGGRLTMLAGIPRGGVPAAYAVAQALAVLGKDIHVATADSSLVKEALSPMPGVVVVDDIYDSGATMRPFHEKGYHCAVLVTKWKSRIPQQRLIYGDTVDDTWVVFPWDESNKGPEDAIVRLMQYLGLDPNSDSLKDTPRRALQWFEEFREGQELGSNLTTFDGETYDEMVLVRDVPFVSLCEHHLVPFVGKAAVAYIPNAIDPQDFNATVPVGDALRIAEDSRSPILGLSKLARIVQWRAKRATVQERLANEIREEVSKAAQTPHVAVSLNAEHFCMTLRGAKAHGATTLTNALGGAFRQDPSTRQEFLSFVRH